MFSRLLCNDYALLARFLIPLAFTDVVVDIGEQFLNRSITKSANVVDTLAAFGLAYVFIKFFAAMLAEIKHVGLMLVHDRPGYLRILVFVLVEGGAIMTLLIIIAKTQLGVWLIEKLHGVSSDVSLLTHSALTYMSAYPLLDVFSWYHGGILLQWHHSTLVGMASLADIVAQIFSVAILLYTPLKCNNAIAIPVLAVYVGVATRCVIVVVGFYRLVFPKLSNRTMIKKLSLQRLTTFLFPLIIVMGAQKISRPVINLLVARSSSSKCEAAESIAVLTAIYPLGRVAYGWLNELRSVSPAFQKNNPEGDKVIIKPEGDKAIINPEGDTVIIKPEGDKAIINPEGDKAIINPEGDTVIIKPEGDKAIINPEGDKVIINPEGDKTVINSEGDKTVITGKKIAFFCIGCFILSAVVSIIICWMPGVSVAILEKVVGISHHLALLCVNPLRVFSFICLTVSVRATVSGWLTLHHQTKLITPSAFVRAAVVVSMLFLLPQLGLTGALMGIASHFSGFFSEMLAVAIAASALACWRRWRKMKYSRSVVEAVKAGDIPLEMRDQRKTEKEGQGGDIQHIGEEEEVM